MGLLNMEDKYTCAMGLALRQAFVGRVDGGLGQYSNNKKLEEIRLSGCLIEMPVATILHPHLHQPS